MTCNTDFIKYRLVPQNMDEKKTLVKKYLQLPLGGKINFTPPPLLNTTPYIKPPPIIPGSCCPSCLISSHK